MINSQGVKSTVLGLCVLALVLVGGALPGWAQDSTKQIPPTDDKAVEILDRFVEVTGGQDAYDAIQNRHMKGRFEIAAMGLTLYMDIYTTKDRRFLSIASSEATGEIRRGYDGTIFWEVSLMSGPRIIEGDELEQAMQETVLEKYVYWRDVYKSASYAGVDSTNGVMCDKVVLTPATGPATTLYFDQKTGMIVREDSVADTQMGQIPIVATASDFREVDGIKMSFASTLSVMNQERQVFVDSLWHNVDVPDSLFAPPEEIKELLMVEPAAEPAVDSTKQ